ncbi:hypothetical protein GCM10009588_08200 [Microbacterium phyllosphaerae]
MGRATGIGRAPLVTKKSPPWQAAGIVGIIALIAAAMLPLIAQILSLPL